MLERGHTIKVELTHEPGPRGDEPRVELLRLLLDDMAGTYRAEDLEYVPHPWLEQRYLQSCVLQPIRRGGDPGGVREPLLPHPTPPSLQATVD